jgi:hydrogenase expression/formation protein HypC
VCLAVPGRILRIFDPRGARTGDVDFAGTVRRVSLAYVPEATDGDYAIVHAGVAIRRIDAAEAAIVLALLGGPVRRQRRARRVTR